MNAIHPPKTETFDLAAGSNTDPKGVARRVDQYRVEEFGLYLARPAPGREQFDDLESWLLPGLGLRVTDFWFTRGHERDQDFYFDVVTIETGTRVWRTTDLYLDLALREGRGLDVLDTDELLAAAAARLVASEEARQALEIVYRTVAGLAVHGYRLDDWLSTMGITLTWQRRNPPRDRS
jgi:uncharacterized protein